ncbi:MAG: 50S ribosomal protein L18 [Rhodobiaceae bacterium]|nr:50S ribosomal protein L18 [Rhodobiaceae bacterium]
MSKQRTINLRRKQRSRTRLRKLANGRPRLSVFRSSKHIYAQVIDDISGTTLASASSKEANFSGDKGSNAEAASIIGNLVAERAVKAGVKEVIFDRGGYIFHGRVKALAEGARNGGLQF